MGMEQTRAKGTTMTRSQGNPPIMAKGLIKKTANQNRTTDTVTTTTTDAQGRTEITTRPTEPRKLTSSTGTEMNGVTCGCTADTFCDKHKLTKAVDHPDGGGDIQRILTELEALYDSLEARGDKVSKHDPKYGEALYHRAVGVYAAIKKVQQITGEQS
jgi:hypothetical protein